jgi:hypothetical protein
MRGKLRLALAAGVCALMSALASGGANAEITARSGEVHFTLVPPADVRLGQHEHSDSGGAHAFNEEQGYRLLTNTLVQICNAHAPGGPCVGPAPEGRYASSTQLKPGRVLAGTCVDSHFFHTDPPGVNAEIYDFTISFDSTIIGVIISSESLDLSDADPGLEPSVRYEKGAARGLELDSNDDVVHIVDSNTITFRFDTPGVMDNARVLTTGDCRNIDPETLILQPDAAVNNVGTQHCVVATVYNEFGAPLPGIVVRFIVTGSVNAIGSKTTDQNGQAVFCYTGPKTPGVDRIHAYADYDKDNVEDGPAANEPADDATKTWAAGPVASILLEPKVDENRVGTEHCVTATVRDPFLNPIPGETVRFSVIGTVTKEGFDQTDTNGVAEFCYTSTKVGPDKIHAYVDDDNDKTQDPTEPFDDAAKLWQPGEAATILLEPKLASNKIQTQHCVEAIVRDAFGNPVPKAQVRFVVTGVNNVQGAATTDEGGEAEFCYTGGTTAGADTITAFVDKDGDTNRDPDEPVDAATKTWLPLEPATLNLTPEADENQVNTEHCLQAQVKDPFLNPNPDIVVRFSVTGTVIKQGSDVTDDGGIAEFCYTSTKSGLDKIHAYADTDNDNTQDPTEPFDDAVKLWQPGAPATLVLDPKTDTNPVGSQHCVRVEVRDAFTNPTPNVVVRFDVEGASEQDTDPADEDGSATTDEFGHATFCYTGPDLPGADVIRAYADTDNDNTQDPGEPSDEGTKTWVFPTPTPGCEVTITNGGWIVTATGSKGTFGGNARVELDGTTRGEEQYQDHSATTPVNFHSTKIVSVVCTPDRTRADIFGTGTVNGVGPVDFRIRVRDLGEPGNKPTDTYQIIVGPYTSGVEDNPLQGGNAQIHVFA